MDEETLKKKPNGHPGVYLSLAALAIVMWFIPHHIISDGAENFLDNLSVFDMVMERATISTKALGTLVVAVIAVFYHRVKK